jgi:zinc/manganese transport system permease protein
MLVLWQQEFIRNAFMAGTIVALVTAVIGYFVVLRAQAFAGESISEIGFAGSTGGPLFGVSSLIGMFVLTILSALGMGVLGERVRGRDVETGMVLAFALGLGVLFTNLYASGRNAAATVNALFGSILSVSRGDVFTTLGAGVVILAVLAALFRPLLFSSVDPEVAQTRGVRVRLLSTTFLVVLAITVAMAIQVVGALLVFALLIAPAASAMRLTHRPLSSIVLSIVFGLGITWLGLLLSIVGTGRYLPASFYITTLATLTYFVAVVVSRGSRSRRGQGWEALQGRQVRRGCHEEVIS